MRSLLLVALLALPAFAGLDVAAEETDVQLGEALQTLADFGRMNLVLLAPAEQRIQAPSADKPWSEAFNELVAQAGLSMRREGNVLVVGAPETMKKRSGARYTMKRVRLKLVDASAADAAELVARACRCAPGGLSGGAPITVAVNDAPADQIVALLRDLSGATPSPRPVAAKTCAAPNTPVAELTLRGTAIGTATPAALFGDKALVGLKGCVGKEEVVVTHIRRDALTLSNGVDLLLGGGSFPSDRPRTRAVPISETLDFIDTLGASAFRAHRKAIGRKRGLLVFLRDALGFTTFEEDLSRTADEQLWNIPYALAAQVDAAIIDGARASEAQLKNAPDASQLHSPELYDAWLARELKNSAAFDAAVEALLPRLEDELKLERLLQEKKTKTVPKNPPPALAWLRAELANKPKHLKRVEAIAKGYGGEG